MKKVKWILGFHFLAMSSQSFAMPQDGCYVFGYSLSLPQFAICFSGLNTGIVSTREPRGVAPSAPLLRMVLVDTSHKVLKCLSTHDFFISSTEQNKTNLRIYYNNKQSLIELRGGIGPNGTDTGEILLDDNARDNRESRFPYEYRPKADSGPYFNQCPDGT